MNREKLFKNLEKRYSSKRDMISRIPLGVNPDSLWQELLNLRRSSSTVLPLYSCNGKPYWYVTTEKMVACSEKIVDALFENETEYDPYTEPLPVMTLEEVFFTGYIEGAQITMQAAMDFLTGEQPPRDIEEQLIVNNRMAGSYASENLYRPIDADFIRELIGILTDGMDTGGQDYRFTDETDYISADGELLQFPPPQVIPERVDALCGFLSEQNIHPLIKASIAQAYLIVTRPFPEGNERLGRILSCMILLRSGYSFFSDVSLSALIARRSYAYYEAAANILREENEGDMTYFVEYFLELLSRAVDERRLRIQNAENEVRQAEIEMARTTLSPPSHTGPPGNMTAKDRASVKEPEVTPNESQLREANEFPDGFHTVSANEPEQSFDDSSSLEISLARIKDRLYEMIDGKGDISKKCSKVLLKLFDEGVYSFNSEDFVQRCGVSRNSASVFIGHLRERGLIEYGDQSPGEYKTYRVKSDLSPLLPGDYSASIINTIRDLQHSETSENDRRLGDLLLSCLPKGLITAAEYEQYNAIEKMPSEMSLPLQMGLISKVARHVYRINRNVSRDTVLVTDASKKVLSIVYQNFGHEWFTRKTIMPVLNKCKSAVDKELHRLSQLHIFECQNESPHKYRLLVDPETHPTFFTENIVPVADPAPIAEQDDADYSDEVYELIDTLATSEFSTRDRRLGTVMQQCIEKGTLFRSDYDDWGYTENMWSIDTELAVLLGLISKESPDSYSLNKELRPELRPTQKKTLTAIYEAFGCDEFSSDMFIATLNYSVSYTYASLHKLTLLRLLDQNIDENGNRYRLVVTPEENPECFDPAA